MTNLSAFLQNFAQRTTLKGKLAERLFRSMLAGLSAAKLDMEAIRSETAAQFDSTAQTQEQLEAHLYELEAHLHELEAHLHELEAQNAAQIAILQEAISEKGAIRQNLETLNVNMRSNNAQLATLQSDTAMTKAKLSGMERHVRDTTTVQTPQVQTSAQEHTQPNQTAYDTIDYFDFENHFRGTIEHIKQAQRIYLPYFKEKHHVLDLGCGRGEFLSLLHEEGIPAVGVDVYEPYTEHCRLQGLEAHCGDGIAYLRQMDDVDGIFAGQVIEHLTTAQITALCETAFEKLPEGGVLVMETPNPTSLAIYTNAFYIDPSHVKPVHPLTMQYLLEKAGFTQVRLVYPDTSRPPQHIPPLDGASSEFNQAMQSVSDMLFGCQDYAVVAIK